MLTTAGVVSGACIEVRSSPDPTDAGTAEAAVAPPGDLDANNSSADTGLEAGPSADADASSLNDAGACAPIDGFCENFDTSPLPGKFSKVIEEFGGKVALESDAFTSAGLSFSSTVPSIGGAGEATAAVQTSFTSNEIDVTFDIRADKVHGGPSAANAYVLRVTFDELADAAEPYHLVGLLLVTSNNTAALQLADYRGITGKYFAYGAPIPLTLGAWRRLRFTLNRQGIASVYDVGNSTALVSAQLNAVSSAFAANAQLNLGVEAYEPVDSLKVRYDSLVVARR